MDAPPPIEYAKTDLSFVRRREVRIGVWSSAIGIISLLAGGGLTFVFGAGAWGTHRDLHPTHAMIAKEKADEAAMHAQNVANFARQRAQLVAKLNARDARGPLGPLDDDACEKVLAVIESLSHQSLTAAQKATIIGELKRQDQTLVDPKLPITADKPTRANVPPLQFFYCDHARDNVQFRVDRVYAPQDMEGGALRVAVDGQIPSRSATRPNSQEALRKFDENAARPDVIGGPFMGPPFSLTREVENGLLVVSAINSMAQFGLAILLLTGAVKACRSDTGWRTRHRQFAIGQIIVAAAAIGLWSALYATSEEDEYHIEAAITAIGVALAVGTMIYPAVLLAILRRTSALPPPNSV